MQAKSSAPSRNPVYSASEEHHACKLTSTAPFLLSPLPQAGSNEDAVVMENPPSQS